MQSVEMLGGIVLLALAVFGLVALRRRLANDPRTSEMRDFAIQLSICGLVVLGGVGVSLTMFGYSGAVATSADTAAAKR